MIKVLLSPHSDDAVLFATHIILRENPLVVTVTHSTLQGDNGYERTIEDYKAMRTLGVPITFLGIDEDELTEDILREKLSVFPTNTFYYIPEHDNRGNPHHNLVHDTIRRMTPHYQEYKTYSGLEDRTIGKEVTLSTSELTLKKWAMSEYKSQIQNPNTAHYFQTYAEYQ